MGPTDGNLYALAQYQKQYDDDDARQTAIDEICEEMDVDEEEADEIYRQRIDDDLESRAEAMYEARMEAALW